MSVKNEDLVRIVTKFAESGWDVIDKSSKTWLSANNENGLTDTIKNELIEAIKQADKECGSCGCDYDPLCKSALESA
jgi:hypothetical protein